MFLPCYLAMTAAEFSGAKRLPNHVGWMACHFSPYSRGLSNVPQNLPPQSLLILSDELPIDGHDPAQILQELQETVDQLDCCGVLLDLQRPGVAETEILARLLTEQLPCPVGVTEFYAADLTCPVFLAMPLRKSFIKVTAPWKGREIWLEAALDAEQVVITGKGAAVSPCTIAPLPEPWFQEKALHCRYHWIRQKDQVVFTVQRTKDDLQELLEEAAGFGVTKAVGLYQQLQAISL